VQSTRQRQTGRTLWIGLAVLVWLEAGLAGEWPLEACRQVALAESGLERYEEGDLDGTIQAFEALVEADSTAAAAHHALARALSDRSGPGDRRRAAEHHRKAAALGYKSSAAAAVDNSGVAETPDLAAGRKIRLEAVMVPTPADGESLLVALDRGLIFVGQDIGYTYPHDLDPGIAAAAETLAVGQYSGVVMGQEGFFVLKLTGDTARPVAKDPDAAAHATLAADLLDQGDVQGATEHYRQAARLDSADAEVRLALGEVLADEGDLEGALPHLEAAVRLNPDDAAAYHRLLDTEKRQRERQAAVGRAEETLLQDPDDAAAHFELGGIYYAAGDYVTAAYHYERVAALDPLRVAAHNNLGGALYALGDMEAAADHFSQAVRLDPELAEAHYFLAYLLDRRGERAEAIEHWRQAVDREPGYALAHHRLGLALQDEGDPQGAEFHLREAIRFGVRPGTVAEACRHLEEILH